MMRIFWLLPYVAAFFSTTAFGSEIHVDLGDLVAGGNGCGAKGTLGINPRDGKSVAATTFAGSGSGAPSFKGCDGIGGKANYPMVDGVMTINGTSVINSLGGAFAFPATGSASTWDAVRNDVSLIDSGSLVTVIQLNDQPGVNRDGIGIHSSAGVTFDLAEIRAHYSGATTLRLDGVAGLNYESCVGANVEIWVIVDGVLKFQGAFLNGGDHQAFSIPLGNTERFVTLACTDQNLSNGCDHGVIADATLVIDAPVPDCNANLLADFCEIASGIATDCNLNAKPDACDFHFKSYGQGCPGAFGFVPKLGMSGCAVAGGTIYVQIDQGLGGANAFLILGLQSAQIPLVASGGCFLLVKNYLPLAAVPVKLAGALPGAGTATLFGQIPSDVGPLSSAALHLQCFVLDPSAPADYSNSAGIEFKIF
jgi:NPCBM/NEW2 domain